MNVVEPIRDADVVRDISAWLKNRSPRDCMMFELGINTALRISDILRLRVGDVRGKDHIQLKEQKTRKNRVVTMNGHLRAVIRECVPPGADFNDYLFRSRVGENRPITRVQAYRILRAACERHGIRRVGTHTLRKTFGYHFYRQTHDITQLQEIMQHSTPQHTLRYIGFNRESVEKAMNSFRVY